MGVHSGRFCAIDAVGAVRNWSVSETAGLKKFVASNTNGGPGRAPGVQDWSGSISIYGGMPLLMPGQDFAFKGYTAPDSGEQGGNGDVYQGQAIVDSVALTWNFENGDLIAHTINFGGFNTPLTLVTGFYDDDSDVEVQECIGLGAEADGEEIANITSITLTLTAENKTYVNSSTNGWTYRERGNFDATLAIAVHDTNDSDFGIAINSDTELKLFVNSTEFWLLQWMKYKERSNLQVDRETGNIIGFTANFELNGFSDGERGQIVAPDESVVWTGTPE